METLNQAGILPVQNYPTLQLKGQGDRIIGKAGERDWFYGFFWKIIAGVSTTGILFTGILKEKFIKKRCACPVLDKITVIFGKDVPAAGF